MALFSSFNIIATEAVKQYSFGDGKAHRHAQKYLSDYRLDPVRYTRKQPNRQLNIAI
jgi:hypothetical protein